MGNVDDPSTWTIGLPIAASVLVATGGWVFTYFHGRRTASRAARLDRVNQQLRLLYGPLYARLKSSDASWTAFWTKYRPAHNQNTYFASGHELSEKELTRWRQWMKEVFHPNNSSLESLIVSHMDLIDEKEMPSAFTDALAHISVYRAVLAQWENGDYSEHTSIMNFPAQELMDVVEPAYKRLREEQKKLISDM